MGLRLGARYFRRLLDAFGGRVERALAAYNAGPGRAGVWAAARPQATAEEFIEAIPYPETRGYVMGILAHREHYRRLYGLTADAVSAPASVHTARGELPHRRLPAEDRPGALHVQAREDHAQRRTGAGPAPAGDDHPALHETRGGLGADRGRRDQGDLHGQHRGERAAVPQGPGRGMDHLRIRHAAARHRHADAARGLRGKPWAARTRSSA